MQGTTIQVDGKDPSMMPTGVAVLNLRDVKHGGYKVVGETPLKLFTVQHRRQGQAAVRRREVIIR